MKNQLLKLKAIVLIVMGTVVLTSLDSCSSDDEEQSTYEWTWPTTGQVRDQVGVVRYNPSNSQWIISSYTEGTIDETVVYYPVNLPDSLKSENLSVIFSGDLAEINNLPIVGGQKNYRLRLIAIHKKISTNEDDEEQSLYDWTGPIVGQVRDQAGVVRYNSSNSHWIIFSHTEGTIDDAVVYYPVNLPDSLKSENLSVIFSGDLAEINNLPIVGGQKNYRLRLIAIHKVE